MALEHTAPAPPIGNDVVDLGADRVGSMATNPRFVARVFSAQERLALGRSEDPFLETWRMWAAKEAAYKVVSKVRGEPPVFVHRDFEVHWDDIPPGTAGGVRSGLVLHEGERFKVRSDVGPLRAWVAAVAAPPSHPLGAPWVIHAIDRIDRSGAPWTGPLDALLERFSERERDAVHSLPSAAVRIAAREAVSEVLGIPNVEIVCSSGSLGRRPPRVLVDGRPSNVDVSLSHDGPWIAWAIALALPTSAPEDTRWTTGND